MLLFPLSGHKKIILNRWLLALKNPNQNTQEVKKYERFLFGQDKTVCTRLAYNIYIAFNKATNRQI